MATKLSIVDLPISKKKVLMRVDFNVPLDNQGHISDDTRIVATLPSIRFVLEHGGSLILMSHLGRPKERDPKLSLTPCAKRLATLLGREVLMAPDCIGPEVEKMSARLEPGQVLMLENLRFHSGEEHPEEDPDFVKQLARLGDLYVNDAFGTAHRSHASTASVAFLFPGKAAAGFLLEREVQFLGDILKNPQRPFLAILGGAKVSTKVGVIQALSKKADEVLIGGGMAYTFFKAQGIAIGKSIHEDNFLEKAKDLLNSKGKTSLLLPQDVTIADHISEDAKTSCVDAVSGIPPGFEGVDIGPKTIQQFIRHLEKAKTIFWNGPLGVFEVSPFARGTFAIAHAIAKMNATTIVGGGDSIAALQAAGVADKITHLSTGGGASLEYIEFGTLPGVEALSDGKEIITPI